MEQLIPIASKLQDVLGALGQSTTLDLPQIVVIGGQSSGKSSVLENVVGRSFLPRGTGIVTRRPLILQLYNTSTLPLVGDDEDDPAPSSSSTSPPGADQEEWGEFLHIPGRRFYNFSDIRQEIIRDTDRLTGKNKGVNPSPIHLKIFSPSVLALTMVDLPGMAKVAVGDQPANIEKQIRDMSMQYISNPNAIILAVTGANTDLANSDAMQLAQTVDPYGERTVGVLTKLDLMDPGTDAAEMLHNKVIPLRCGYIGVVNRGQRDVDSDLSIRDGLKKEHQFFRSHPVYGRDRVLAGKCGTVSLSKALNTILMHHIRDCLPELKSRIASMIVDVQSELDALGRSTDGPSSSTLGGSLLSLLSKFTTNFSSTIDGRGNMMNPSSSHYSTAVPASGGTTMDTNELFGGARIAYIFNDIFSSSLISVGVFDGLSDEEIRATICNANGTRPSLFVPEISFDILVRRQISRLEQPGIQCVDLVYEELQRISSQCEPNELVRFPTLRDRIVEVVSALLKRAVVPTQMMVSNLVKIELAYINTSHPDFIGGSRAVALLMEKMGKEDEGKTLKHSKSPPIKNQISDVGAASLSSPSLSHCIAGDEVPGEVSHYLGNVSQPAYDYNHANGGIMNFIFRGSKTPDVTSNGTFSSPTRISNNGPPNTVQLPQIPDCMRQTKFPITDREVIEMEIIKSLIESYFSIVRKNFIDMVPKTIMYFLVNHVRDAMQNELVAELYRDTEITSLMKEADDVAQRRKTCLEMKDLLTKALEIVNEVRDFNTFK